MKRVFVYFLLMSSVSVIGQEGIRFGLDISPAVKVNTQRSKTTGRWAFSSGYGFSVGIPVKIGLSESSSLNTGLLYEYTGFDQFNNGILASSFRISAIQLPLMLNNQIKNNWYWSVGAGANYNFNNTQLNAGIRQKVNSLVNQFQPWIGGGVNTLIERDFGAFELGGQLRYQLVPLWKKDTPSGMSAASRILALDLNLRFYI